MVQSGSPRTCLPHPHSHPLLPPLPPYPACPCQHQQQHPVAVAPPVCACLCHPLPPLLGLLGTLACCYPPPVVHTDAHVQGTNTSRGASQPVMRLCTDAINCPEPSVPSVQGRHQSRRSKPLYRHIPKSVPIDIPVLTMQLMLQHLCTIQRNCNRCTTYAGIPNLHKLSYR